jgi:hypothetical protein
MMMMMMVVVVMMMMSLGDDDDSDGDITFDEGRVHELSVDLDPTAQERAIKRPVVVPERSSYLITHHTVKCAYSYKHAY